MDGVFKVRTLFVLIVVAAAIVIPVLHSGKEKPQEVGVVGTLSSSLRATVTTPPRRGRHRALRARIQRHEGQVRPPFGSNQRRDRGRS